MNGFFLLLPLLLIRYGILSLLDKDALRRAAQFPPMEGNERIAFWIYQLSTMVIFVYLCFLRVKTQEVWFYAGMLVYGLGTLLFAIATVNFAAHSDSGMRSEGLYKWSRNPMYVAYFLYFLGCALLTQSIVLLALTLVFQVSSHWIILAEERWCRHAFGEAYRQYTQKVRRYV